MHLPVPFRRCLLPLIACFTLTACEKPHEQLEYSIFAFGTLIDITLFDVDRSQSENIFAHMQQSFDRYQQEWSPWTQGDLAKLNQRLATGDKAHITLPPHLAPLIEQSITLSKESEERYNPAIGLLINLWQFHRYEESDIRPPSDEAIQAIVDKHPSMSDLTIHADGTLSTSNPAVQLNFGAYAKGYAISQQIAWLKQNHISHAIINAGGDLCSIGHHGDRPWNIGIRDPRKDSILASVEMRDDECVFTSGDYERFYFYQGKRYHHILDARTGYPTDDMQSVTVLHTDAGLADAAATALMVAGREQWQQTAKNMGITHAMLVDRDGDIHLTPAMRERIKILNKSPTSHIIISDEL